MLIYSGVASITYFPNNIHIVKCLFLNGDETIIQELKFIGAFPDNTKIMTKAIAFATIKDDQELQENIEIAQRELVIG